MELRRRGPEGGASDTPAGFAHFVTAMGTEALVTKGPKLGQPGGCPLITAISLLNEACAALCPTLHPSSPSKVLTPPPHSSPGIW